MNRFAVLYDFLQVKGGAEAVTLDLCKHFENMDLITSWVNNRCFPQLPVNTSRVMPLSSTTNVQGWQTIKSSMAFLNKTPDLSTYDSVIFSGSNAPLAILKSRAKRNIYYCHTPPRFIYDLKDYYLESIPLWQRPALTALISWLQPRYEKALQNMDVVLCNSNNVRQRLKSFLNLESRVVYPPIAIDRFENLSNGDYFLSTARLEPYKRVESIVKAFMKMPDQKLVVTSGGSQEKYLRALAFGHRNIQFTGWVAEEELVKLVGNCLATIYIPKDEDFGMSPVESMGAGKPVIGVKEGGVKETIINNETGWLLSSLASPVEIISLVESLNHADIHDMNCRCVQRASEFHSDYFFSDIGDLLSEPLS